MNEVPNFADRFNKFLYRRYIRKLSPAERETAKAWCMDLIRREHPNLTDEQRELLYQNLINVQVTAVDQWTQRMT